MLVKLIGKSFANSELFLVIPSSHRCCSRGATECNRDDERI